MRVTSSRSSMQPRAPYQEYQHSNHVSSRSGPCQSDHFRGVSGVQHLTSPCPPNRRVEVIYIAFQSAFSPDEAILFMDELKTFQTIESRGVKACRSHRRSGEGWHNPLQTWMNQSNGACILPERRREGLPSHQVDRSRLQFTRHGPTGNLYTPSMPIRDTGAL